MLHRITDPDSCRIVVGWGRSKIHEGSTHTMSAYAHGAWVVKVRVEDQLQPPTLGIQGSRFFIKALLPLIKHGTGPGEIVGWLAQGTI